MQIEEFLQASAEKHPDKTALVCGEERLTYREMEVMSSRLARVLLDRGVSPGDRVAVYLDNCAEAVISVFGILKARAVVMLINSTTKPPKLGRLLDLAEASMLVTRGRWARKAARELSALRRMRCIFLVEGPAKESGLEGAQTRPFEEIVRGGGETGPFQRRGGEEGDLAVLMFTSGSTGEPKGVMLTHGNQVSVCRSITEYLENTASDIILSVLPLSFSYGLNQILTAFRVGATVVLEQSFLYSHSIMQKLVLERATGLPIVPTISAILLQLDLAKYDLSSLRYITNAGAALPPSHTKELRRRLPHVRVFAMYGQTECTRISYLSPEQIDIRPTSVGRGIPGQASCVVDEQGLPVGPGVIGELVVEGPHVMAGYWGLPDETKQKLRPFPKSTEPALHTGDLFRTDEEGYLYFVSRKDDIIKSRGEKVSPKEVEDVLYGIQGVAEAAVVGVPDPVLGEAVKAFVVPQPGAALTERDVLRACAHHLEDFMVPQAIEFREALPKTSSGKIRKTELREQAAQGGASPR